jgi:hypothetical protein
VAEQAVTTQGEDGLPAGVRRHDAKERLRDYVSGKLGARHLQVVRFEWEMSTLGDPLVEIGWSCGCIETLGVSEDGLRPAEITEAREAFLTAYAQVTGRTLDVDKIRFGEVFYNYQLCSVTVSGQWMRRQTGEVLPEAQSAGPSFRNELERLIA